MTFYIDIWFEKVNILSCTASCALGSTTFYAGESPHDEYEREFGEFGSMRGLCGANVKIPDGRPADAFERLRACLPKQGPNCLKQAPLHAMLSYSTAVVDASGVSRTTTQEPTFLLNESHTYNTMHDEIVFRTKADESFVHLPQHSTHDRQEYASNSCTRYANAPLPFDPCIKLFISPRGEDCGECDDEMGRVWIKGDSAESCCVRAEVHFSDSPSLYCWNFRRENLPDLLSLELLPLAHDH